MDELDMDARYTVTGRPGVAVYVVGYATEPREVEIPLCEHDDNVGHDEDCEVLYETEMVERTDMVRVVMVGDDREELADVEDLTVLGDDDYCGGCGQVGCGWTAA